MGIDWGSEYTLGIEPFDGQHGAMMGIIARLARAAAAPEGKSAWLPLVDELIQAAETHFSAEEAELEKRGYPELIEHGDEHRNLLNEVREIRARIASGESVLNAEMADFLANWMAVHVKETDMPYRRLFGK
jgi:hemerythrin